MDKKRTALDGLLGKLDTQLSAEHLGLKRLNLTRGSTSTPLTSPLGNQLGNQPHLTNPSKPKLDPLSMLPKVSKARQRRQAMRKAKHSKVIKIPNKELGIEIEDGSDNDLKDVDQSKFKTMDWTEPDGSKTKLRFDEDGTLIGKDKK